LFTKILSLAEYKYQEEIQKMPEYIKSFIEVGFGLGMFVNAVLFLPQVIKIYKTRNVQSLSLITFAGFNTIQLFSLLHGYIHKDYIFMFGMSLSLILSGSVTSLIIIQKNKKSTATNLRS
jgi:MtN3 and saliva related transmembrane protein